MYGKKKRMLNSIFFNRRVVVTLLRMANALIMPEMLMSALSPSGKVDGVLFISQDSWVVID